MAVIINLCNARPGKVSAIISNYAFPHVFIIAIKYEREIFIEKLVARFVGFQYKFLKKPSCVAKVPFGRGNINDWLNNVIFNFQRFADIFSMLAGFEKERNQSIGCNHKKSAAIFFDGTLNIIIKIVEGYSTSVKQLLN